MLCTLPWPCLPSGDCGWPSAVATAPPGSLLGFFFSTRWFTTSLTAIRVISTRLPRRCCCSRLFYCTAPGKRNHDSCASAARRQRLLSPSPELLKKSAWLLAARKTDLLTTEDTEYAEETKGRIIKSSYGVLHGSGMRTQKGHTLNPLCS